jgi:hypothetical protein
MRDRDGRNQSGGKERGRHRDRFEFYYYERVGEDRYYLRITRFALYLMMVLGVAALIFFSLLSSGSRPPDINIKVPAPDPSPTVLSPGFGPAPSSPTPARQGTGAGSPSRRRSPSPTPAPAGTPVVPPGLDPPRAAPTARQGPAPANTHAAPAPTPLGNANE